MPASFTMPRRLPPRRFIVLFGFLAFFLLSALLLLVTAPAGSLEKVKEISESIPHHLSDHVPRPKSLKLTVPSFRIPSWRPTHQPPVQANSTSGETQWYTDWRWLHPFSSSITLDENRALLPPLRERPPVYTFYEASAENDEATRAAENDLLLIWRRAWWAHGFRPIVLGREEAMNNPLYQSVQHLGLEGSIEFDVARWLAWEYMGAGILANWLAVPMGSYDDPLLSFLRKGDYPDLTRYEGLRGGLFSGSKAAAVGAFKMALENKDLNRTASFVDALPKDAFKVDPAHQSIALYDIYTIKNRYQLVSEKFTSSEADGLRSLGRLINSHLHTTFQNSFPKGIAVLNPTEKRVTALVQPALQIASYLAECTESPMPTSCPPNRPKCKPCVSAHPLRISTPSVFRNTSTLYTIGTAPHPYTLAILTSQRANLDAAYIRRRSDRDRWILAMTKELLGTGVGTVPRLMAFKEAVASEWGSARSLWLTPEKEPPNDLDWHFGFAVPKNVTDKGYSTPPVPGRKPNKPDLDLDTVMSSPDELQQEKVLIETATKAVRSSVRPQRSVREMIEAWNLADTEAWRFARAFVARSRVERLDWEGKEKKFGGGSMGGSSKGWARWLDGLRS